MSSRAHDFIVAALARKARENGFVVVALGARQQHIVEHRLALPPSVLRHRPDLVAVSDSGGFCIGEAKLAADLCSERTREQFSDFTLAVQTRTDSLLLVGVPLAAQQRCRDALLAAGAQLGRNVQVLVVPDTLLPNEDEV